MGRHEVHVYREIAGRALELELVRPAGGMQPRPAVLFFHGGGWRLGSRELLLPQCEFLASRGAIGVSAGYRLAREDAGTTPMDCVDDALHAVRWLRANAAPLGVDPARIAAGGGSAGGQMAAAVAAIGEPLAALVLFNPALALDGSPRLPFMGDACPAWEVDARLPPTLIQHGTADRLVPIDHVRRYAERLRAAGGSCELVEYEGMPHAFFNRPAPEGRRDETLTALAAFLGALGWLEGEDGVAARGAVEPERPGALPVRK